jgi:hypothetical protein
MANVLTDFQNALASDLAAQYPLAEVMRGERVGKAVDKARVCVFWPGTREIAGRVQEAEATVIVRYWPVTAKVRDQASQGVRDPSELEQAAWDLQTFLQTKQVAYSASGAWFCRLTSVEPDYDPEEWGVQATITLQFLNPATLP